MNNFNSTHNLLAQSSDVQEIKGSDWFEHVRSHRHSPFFVFVYYFEFILICFKVYIPYFRHF